MLGSPAILKRIWVPAEIGNGLTIPPIPSTVTPDVERTDPDGVDYGWVMQITFVMTILVGVPIVAGLSLFTPLPTWESRASFAIRVGSFVWFCTAVSVYIYARNQLEE